MAAFCGCCGKEITEKAEACPVCGIPRHGMWPGEPPSLPGIKTVSSKEDKDNNE